MKYGEIIIKGDEEKAGFLHETFAQFLETKHIEFGEYLDAEMKDCGLDRIDFEFEVEAGGEQIIFNIV